MGDNADGMLALLMAADRFKQSVIETEARAAFESGDYSRAATLIRDLLKERGGRDAQLLHMLGVTLTQTGDYLGARKPLQKALKIDPRHADSMVQMATVLKHDGRLREAHRWTDRALKIRNDHPQALTTKAELHRLSGDAAAAFELLHPIVDAGAADVGVLLRYVEIAPRFVERDVVIGIIRTALDGPSCTGVARGRLLFRLSALYEAGSEAGDAFDAMSEARALTATPFDSDAHERAVDDLIQNWSASLMPGLPRSACASEVPVFIVGMPRSGTSLVEQIIATHPDAEGCGELKHLSLVAADLFGTGGMTDAWLATRYRQFTAAEANDGAARYLREMQSAIEGSPSRATDKMPYNYLLVGLIGLLFPHARIVHCVRNPMDTCLSCYGLEFTGVQHAYMSTQESLGRYYRQYQRIMDHWRSVATVPILDVRYESMVEDIEAGSRRLIDFLGLPWDDACLAFHENRRATVTLSADQVRRKIYATAVGRHEQYGARLDPLRAALAE